MNNLILKIAREFRKAKIHWGIGGSKLLNFYGITNTVNDLDILVSKENIEEALQTLLKLGTPLEIPNKSEYLTESFHRFEVEGIELDLMSDFKIEHEAGVYDFQFDSTTKVQTVQLGDEEIPLTSLEEWYIAYLLMKNRESKVQMIEDYFIKEKKLDLGLLMNRMQQGIPIDVLMQINRLVIEVRELMEVKSTDSHPYDGLYKD